MNAQNILPVNNEPINSKNVISTDMIGLLNNKNLICLKFCCNG